MAEKKEKKAAEEQTEETKATPAEEKKEEKNEWQDKYIRLYADFDNYKKRTAREALSSYQNGLISAVETLLPVIDNFDRAAASIAEDDDSTLAQGVKMVAKQFADCLDKLGVKPIDAKGKKFDPNMHNAVMHIEDDSFGENEVAEELLKGYTCGDRVVRHSMVKVAN